jgi:hypothetical protein
MSGFGFGLILVFLSRQREADEVSSRFGEREQSEAAR